MLKKNQSLSSLGQMKNCKKKNSNAVISQIFQHIQIGKRKCSIYDEACDDEPITDLETKFEVEVYFKVIDIEHWQKI